MTSNTTCILPAKGHSCEVKIESEYEKIWRGFGETGQNPSGMIDGSHKNREEFGVELVFQKDVKITSITDLRRMRAGGNTRFKVILNGIEKANEYYAYRTSEPVVISISEPSYSSSYDLKVTLNGWAEMDLRFYGKILD